MINFNSYIKNNLNEGLILTHPISLNYDKLKNSINLLFDNKLNFNILPNYLDETFILEINETLSYKNFDKLNSICNNFGYFISMYTVLRNNIQNTFKYNTNIKQNIKNNTGLILYYESKFDKEIIPPSKLYHATNIKNYLKINKIGLYPKSTSKLKYHLDRIYFSTTLQNCENLIPILRNFDITNTTKIKDYIVLEIDTVNFNQKNFDNTITNVKFREVPNSKGIYTYNNIPKNRINLINNIYTNTDIIQFDDIKINKNNISAFYNNFKVYSKNIV